MSTYDLITEHILQTLARGVVPWHQPWTVGIPRNLVSRQPHRGINVWLTVSAGFSSPDWLTFNQAKDLRGSIQRAAKGTPVVFWKWFDTEGDGEETNPRRVPLLRAYTVFNLEQTTGIDTPVDSDTPTFQPFERCEVFVASMPQRPSIHHGEARACYHPLDDVIHMPHSAWFNVTEAYYSTFAAE